jgi:hypothetical protein
MTTSPAPIVAAKSQAITKVSYSHDAMIDLIIQEPTVTTAELGKLFNYSSAWVARVVASDAFQARLAERKEVLVDPHVAQSLNERLRGVAIHAIDLVGEKLQSEQSASYAMDALGIASVAMGMGQRKVAK